MMDAESSSAVLAGSFTAQEGLQLLHDIFDRTGEALRLGLPAMLVSSGIITGILAALLPGRVCARRGDDLEYVPVSGWFLPAQLAVGLLVALATALILQGAGVNGSESVLPAVLTGGEVIFAVAGAAAMSRQFKKNGRPPVFRAVIIILALALVSRLMALIGIYSALFGQKGLISGYIRKKAEERDKEDDDL